MDELDKVIANEICKVFKGIGADIDKDEFIEFVEFCDDQDIGTIK